MSKHCRYRVQCAQCGRKIGADGVVGADVADSANVMGSANGADCAICLDGAVEVSFLGGVRERDGADRR